MCLVVMMYVFGAAWVFDTFEGLSKGIYLLGFSWRMIDVPNMIQKILGIDADLSSGIKTTSVYHISRTAWVATKGDDSIAKKIAEVVYEDGGAMLNLRFKADSPY